MCVGARSSLTSDPVVPASSCDQEQQSAQEEARQHKNDAVFVPDCAQGGLYKPVQCHPSTGYCWCVLVDTGRPIPGTSTRWVRLLLPQFAELYRLVLPRSLKLVLSVVFSRQCHRRFSYKKRLRALMHYMIVT